MKLLLSTLFLVGCATTPEIVVKQTNIFSSLMCAPFGGLKEVTSPEQSETDPHVYNARFTCNEDVNGNLQVRDDDEP